MGGRGRGRGRPLVALSGDQNLGPNEVLPPTLNPPRDFPPLEHKALPLGEAEKRELSYLYQLKKGFIEFMQESPYYVKPTMEKKDIERYSDKYQAILSSKQSYETLYDWDMLPAELKPAQKKKRKGDQLKTTGNKKLKEIDINNKLQELEKKEITQASDAEEDEKDEENDAEDNLEEQEEEVDEEMDDGTDYVNNYFDNGENYEDDDENLDEATF